MLTESQMWRYIVKEKKSFEIEILIKQKEFWKETEFIQQAVSHHLKGGKGEV